MLKIRKQKTRLSVLGVKFLQELTQLQAQEVWRDNRL